MKIISNNEDYVKLKQKNDTSYAGYKPIVLREVDFDKYDLIGCFITNAENNVKKMYYKNLKTKEVFYYVLHTILTVNGEIEFKMSYSQNWLLIPKIPNDYKLFFDIKVKYEEK